MQHKLDEVRSLFYTYSGALTYLFIVGSIIAFVFAEYFVMILGGSQYLQTDPQTGANAVTIMRILCIYEIFDLTHRPDDRRRTGQYQ